MVNTFAFLPPLSLENNLLLIAALAALGSLIAKSVLHAGAGKDGSSARFALLKASSLPAIILICFHAACFAVEKLAWLWWPDYAPAAEIYAELVRKLGTGAIVGWWCFRLVLIVEKFLVATALRTEVRADDYIFPLIGFALRALVPTLLVIYLALVMPLDPEWVPFVRKIVAGYIILAIGWFLYRAIGSTERVLLEGFEKNKDPDFSIRSVVSRVRLLRRITTAVLCVLILASLLMLFDQVRHVGGSILASAGIAGVVLGLAAQRTFGNLFAGVQMAIAQPVRIGDQINVEKESGTVEEITLTYVVVKLWDLRRLVLPISYFIEQPFLNLSRTSTDAVGSIILSFDYTIPVDALRSYLDEIIKQSPHWSGKKCALHVTGSTELSMQIRIIASAVTPGQSFELQCEIREKMIAYVQKNYPASLPKSRSEQKAIVDWTG